MTDLLFGFNSSSVTADILNEFESTHQILPKYIENETVVLIVKIRRRPSVQTCGQWLFEDSVIIIIL